MRILISNGSNQFHLAPLASELHRQGHLAGLLTSGWPTPLASAIARPFEGRPAVQRFFNRRENVPAELLYATNISEIIFQIGIRLRRFSGHAEERFDRIGFAWYTRYATRVLKKLRPDIYHYRACYGLSSVHIARKLGIPSLCDHSIAHPSVLQYMVDHEGRWPEEPERDSTSPLQQLMRIDIHNSDEVLANSDFVKETCIYSGVAAERIHVVYLGVDQKFFTSVPDFDLEQIKRRAGSALLFAGGVQKRKGVSVLARAFADTSPEIKLRLVGGHEIGIENDPLIKRFLNSSNIKVCGTVPRLELAREMITAPIFIFPSFCEGSARVIFEAMACGCFIITTPNSGSIVKDGEHGFVVPPGDSSALAAAISRAWNSPEMVARVGWSNAQLVRREFRQDQYAGKVLELYRRILGRVN